MAPRFRNLYDSTNNPVHMQCLLVRDMATKIKEFAEEHKLSHSISAWLYPYQRLSPSTHKQFLDAARSWMNSESHSNSLNLTSHGSHQQHGHQTGYQTSIRVQERERGQESAVVDEYLGHNGNVHVTNLTFKTVQNDAAQ